MNKRIVRTTTAAGNYYDGYIFGNYGCSLVHYLDLIREAKEDFPFLTDDKISLEKVAESSYMKGFIYIHFSINEKDIKEGYDIWNYHDFEPV